MDIFEIRDKYFNGDYDFKLDIPKKVSEHHVFDEDLSVKRNRELVEEHNAEVDRLNQYKLEQQGELDKRLVYDVEKYIIDQYDLTAKQASIIESFVQYMYHSCMYDYFCYIDTYAEFAVRLLNKE